MKLKMAQNSLFAILLRSAWWISALIALVMVLLALALLPAQWRVVGALSATPFVVIAAMAFRRQWHLPSQASVEQAEAALRGMAWPAFAQLLEQGFRRDGYAVERSKAEAFDFELKRGSEHLLVSARRWKTASTGVEPLRALQAARESSGASHALCICLGPLSDAARPFAAKQRITVWQAADLALALRGLLPGAAGSSR
jgi:restriction system protein